MTMGLAGGTSGKVALLVKNLPANSGDIRDRGSIPGLGRPPGGGHALQYSCLENPMDRRTWQVAVHSYTESDKTEATQHAPRRDFN